MFCEIELDEKTFGLVCEYLEFCVDDKASHRIDMGVQQKEMQNHIYRNWMDDNAGVHWVEEHAKNFRIYLNTIKILWSAHVLVKGKDTEFTFDEFKHMQKNYHQVKPVLENIY